MDNLRIEIKKVSDQLVQEQKLPLYEMHILRATGGEMLNRGFNGRHKTLVVGGVPRYRVSSQSKKHAVRMRKVTDVNCQTRYFPYILKQKLNESVQDPAAEALINSIVEAIFKDSLNDKKSKKKSADALTTKQVIKISAIDVDAFTDIILDKMKHHSQDDESTDAKREAKAKKIAEECRSILEQSANSRQLDESEAVYGRMSTDNALSTVYSAVHVNHAYSVNPTAGDYDDFTATDDYLTNYLAQFGTDEDTKQIGSGHMNCVDIGSNVYYEYASLSTRIVFENLMQGRSIDEDTIKWALKKTYELTEEFIVSYAMTLPSAKQNSMATYAEPMVLYMTRGTGVYPRTFDSAFEKAIIGTDVESTGEQAKRRLLSAIEKGMSGAFAVNEYDGQYWFSDGEEDLSRYNGKVQACSLRDVKKIVEG